jgi:hypothetical protein
VVIVCIKVVRVDAVTGVANSITPLKSGIPIPPAPVGK